jgi:hypothetical protein
MIRSLDQKLAQMVRRIGQSIERPLEVQITGVYQSKRLGHRRLLARNELNCQRE